MFQTWILRGCGVAVALLTLGASWNGYVENTTFADHGRVATLEPISEYTERTTTTTRLGIQVSQSKSRSAVMTFEADGQSYTINRNLPDDVFDQLNAGQPVQIEYLPERPMATARFVDHPSMAVESALLGIVIAAATFVFWRKM